MPKVHVGKTHSSLQVPTAFNNLFQLQADELQKSCPSSLVKDEITLFLSKVEKVLVGIKTPPTKYESFFPRGCFSAGFQPDPASSHKVRCQFDFTPPAKLNFSKQFADSASGCLMRDTTQPSRQIIDLHFPIPEECFAKRDHLDHRCLFKQTLYLAALAHVLDTKTKHLQLRGKPSLQRSKPGILHGFKTLPFCHYLQLECTQFQGVLFRIHGLLNGPIFDERVIVTNGRFAPTVNNVRAIDKKSGVKEEEVDDKERCALPPTPIYNAYVLSQTAFVRANAIKNYIAPLFSRQPNAPFAIALISKWISRHSSIASKLPLLSPFQIALVLAYKVDQKQPANLDSFALFQRFVAGFGEIEPSAFSADSSDSTLTFSWYLSGGGRDDAANPSFLPADSHVALLDSKHNPRVNFLSNTNSGDLDYLIVLAKRQLHLFNSVGVAFASDNDDSVAMVCQRLCVELFQSSFGTGVSTAHECFDQVWTFPITSRVSYATVLLRRGLSDRVTCLRTLAYDGVATLGVNFNSSEFSRLLDKGPVVDQSPENSKKADVFTEFWGSDLAHTRKFQDGSFFHCVAWLIDQKSKSAPLMHTRRQIPSMIADHVLSNHGFIDSKISFIDDAHLAKGFLTPSFTSRPGGSDSIDPCGVAGGTGEEQVRALKFCYENLRMLLNEIFERPAPPSFKGQPPHTVTTLPLKIVSVQPADEAFVGTSAKVPLPSAIFDASKNRVVVPGNKRKHGTANDESSETNGIQREADVKVRKRVLARDLGDDDKRAGSKTPSYTCLNQVPRVDAAVQGYLRPFRVTVQLEGSKAWPKDNPEAVRHLIALFHQRLAQALKADRKIKMASTATNDTCYADLIRLRRDCIDVRIFLPRSNHSISNTFLFRVALVFEEQLISLTRFVTPMLNHSKAAIKRNPAAFGPNIDLSPGLDPGTVTTRRTPASFYWRQSNLLTPRLTEFFQAVATSHPAFPGSVRLLKRWFAGHLLENQIPVWLPEIFVCVGAGFCANLDCLVEPPTTCLAGFVRTLKFVATFDFTKSPIILPSQASTNQETMALLLEQQKLVLAKFGQTTRSELPAVCVASPPFLNFDDLTIKPINHNKQSSKSHQFTSTSYPSIPALQRIINLAKRACLDLIGDEACHAPESHVFLKETVFEMDREEIASFDAVFTFKPSFNAHAPVVRWPRTGDNFKLPTTYPVVDFNPVAKMVHLIERCFPGILSAFASFTLGQFGLVFTPQAKKSFLLKEDVSEAGTKRLFVGDDVNICHRDPDFDVAALDDKGALRFDTNFETVLEHVKFICGGAENLIL